MKAKGRMVNGQLVPGQGLPDDLSNLKQSALGEDHPETIKAKEKLSEIQAKMAKQENK